MGFLTSLFGGENAILTMIIALVVVIVLIILAVWALKLVFGASGRVARGRAKRLAVVDLAPVDQKRQLVLIRRDGVEHLLMIGGAQDVVIETGIPVEEDAATARPPRRGVPAIVKQRPAPQQTAPLPQADEVANFDEAVREPEPAREPVVEKPAANVDSLEDLGKPLAERKLGAPQSERKRTSLRHTGLLRPVTRTEPSLIPTSQEKSEPPLTDSDKNGAGKNADDGIPADEVRVQPDDDGAGEVKTAQAKK